jgi:hypothetical protein
MCYDYDEIWGSCVYDTLCLTKLGISKIKIFGTLSENIFIFSGTFIYYDYFFINLESFTWCLKIFLAYYIS